jgi:UDP-glucose 4-epimerase
MTTLITGGLGFIGLHTARALLDLGEDLVLTQYRVTREPDFIKDELGKRAKVEQLDVTDKARLDEIGRAHKIDRILHLAVPGLGALSPLEDFTVNTQGLINILEAGREWEVSRIGLGSSLAVYQNARGEGGVNREDQPLAMAGGGPTGTWKKTFEIIGAYYGDRTGLDIVNMRIAGIYGPLYHSMSNLPSRLVHAAVKKEPPVLRGDTYAEDGTDMTYVKDCGRGLALLMKADKLNHKTYNVATGRASTPGELVSAIQSVVPDFDGSFLKEGASPGNPGPTYSDISRIQADTDYKPEFPVENAIPDYIAWLRAGNAE